MAKTIAHAIGVDSSGRTKQVTRLGSQSSTGKAATWRTFAEATVFASGRVSITVKRDDKTILSLDIGPEGQSPQDANNKIVQFIPQPTRPEGQSNG